MDNTPSSDPATWTIGHGPDEEYDTILQGDEIIALLPGGGMTTPNPLAHLLQVAPALLRIAKAYVELATDLRDMKLDAPWPALSDALADAEAMIAKAEGRAP